jgi:hypothetical protein
VPHTKPRKPQVPDTQGTASSPCQCRITYLLPIREEYLSHSFFIPFHTPPSPHPGVQKGKDLHTEVREGSPHAQEAVWRICRPLSDNREGSDSVNRVLSRKGRGGLCAVVPGICSGRKLQASASTGSSLNGFCRINILFLLNGGYSEWAEVSTQGMELREASPWERGGLIANW